MAKSIKKNFLLEFIVLILAAITFLCGIVYVIVSYSDTSSGQDKPIFSGSNMVTERYYCTVDSEAEALGAAIEAGGRLESYDNGVGVILIERPYGNVVGVGAPLDEIDTGDVILKKEEVYRIDETKAPQTNPLYKQQWYLDSINIKNTYKNGITGKGTLVAVLDTGCQVDHPDLQRNIVGWYNANNPESTEVTDDDGHGTHVAGIIGAVDNGVGTVGIAPDVSLYIIKVDHGDGYMYISDIIRGLNKAIEINADVINMSLGGYFKNEDYEAVLNKAADNGALCVAAAGNDHLSLPHYPAAYASVIGVASYEYSGRLASSSNYGVNADIAAPGVNIWSSYYKSLQASLSGTSMATPVVSGVAALIYSQNQGLRDNNDRWSRDYVYSAIMNARAMTSYSSSYGTVSGGLNVQNIFNLGDVAVPATVTMTEKKESGTNQTIIKFKCKTGGTEIYYTTDGSYPYVGIAQKYEGKIRLDKKGTYKIRAVAVKGRTYSKLFKQTVKVEGKVYSQALVQSMRIHLKNEKTTRIAVGKEKQLYVTFDKKPKKKIDLTKIKWSSSNEKLATVSADGKVKVTTNKKKVGKSVTITGKLGSVKKTFTFTIK